MLDTAIKTQLRQVYADLGSELTLVHAPSDHEKQGELVTLLTELASTSPRLSVREEGPASAVPSVSLLRDGQPVGVRFVGVPGGHEFTSLVLAVLHADGQGKRPDPALVERIQRLKGPIRLRTFVSLSCTNCPDVVQALNLLATLHPDLEHETIDGAVLPDEVERLHLQGVPAVLRGDELLSSGKTTLAELLARLEEAYGSEEAEARDLGEADVVVIGGGPAGASAAIYSARKGLKTLVVTDRLGGQLQDTKGIENLISVPYIEGPQLSAKLGEHLGAYGVELLSHRRVVEVRPGQPVELVLDSGETLRTHALIVATGAKWRELGVAGEKEYLGRGVAFCPHCDGPMFKGKDIAVVGGGNSGVEAALDLAGLVRSVTVLEFLDEAKADQVLLDKLHALPNAELVTRARTLRVEGDGARVTGLVYEDRESGEERQLDLDGVFVQIGLVPNSAFLDGVVERNRYGEIEVDTKCRTSAPGIYAAGDVTTVPYKQIVVAMGEGAKAALAAFEDRMVA